MLRLMKDELNALEAYSSIVNRKLFRKYEKELKKYTDEARRIGPERTEQWVFWGVDKRISEIQEGISRIMNKKVSPMFDVEQWIDALERMEDLRDMIEAEYRKNDLRTRIDFLLRNTLL